MSASTTIEPIQEESAFPIRSGVFVAVAGPSGAGKDSVLDYARQRLAQHEDIVFARRVITRPMEEGGEVHDTLDEECFELARQAGRFALTWRAHGLGYALPASIDEVLRGSGVVVANVSRGVLGTIRSRYANVVPVIVTAPPKVLAERLTRRGRETKEEVLDRLSRANDAGLAIEDAVVIDNSGPLDMAGEHFLRLLRKATAWSDVCDRV